MKELLEANFGGLFLFLKGRIDTFEEFMKIRNVKGFLFLKGRIDTFEEFMKIRNVKGFLFLKGRIDT